MVARNSLLRKNGFFVVYEAPLEFWNLWVVSAGFVVRGTCAVASSGVRLSGRSRARPTV